MMSAHTHSIPADGATQVDWVSKHEDLIAEILQRYPVPRSAIMPLLHLAQEERGYHTAEDYAQIGDLVGETQAYVESVASFYALYRKHPHGKYTLTVCHNLSCCLGGADRLVEHLTKQLGVESGETTPDGLFTLEVTGECLAACDSAPVVQVNLDYHLGVTPEKADELLEALRKEAKPLDAKAQEKAS